MGHKTAIQFLAFLLSITLCPPSSAFGLRASEPKEDPRRRSGLEEALSSGNPDDLVQISRTHIARFLSPTFRAGLEEGYYEALLKSARGVKLVSVEGGKSFYRTEDDVVMFVVEGSNLVIGLGKYPSHSFRIREGMNQDSRFFSFQGREYAELTEMPPMEWMDKQPGDPLILNINYDLSIPNEAVLTLTIDPRARSIPESRVEIESGDFPHEKWIFDGTGTPILRDPLAEPYKHNYTKTVMVKFQKPTATTSVKTHPAAGMEEFSEAQIQAEAELAARPLLAAEMLRNARPAVTATLGRGPLILFQALWLGGLYPPMTEELRAEIGIVEVTPDELEGLADAAPEYEYDSTTPAEKIAATCPIPNAIGRVGQALPSSRIEELDRARFVLVRYKLPSGVDPDVVGKERVFPQRPWRALMLLHQALRSDILMIDYAKNGTSGAMEKASVAFYGHFINKSPITPNELSDAWRSGSYGLVIPEPPSEEPSLFFVRPNDFGRASPFDPNRVYPEDRTPERYANDPKLMRQLSQAVLTLYRQKAQPAGLEEREVAVGRELAVAALGKIYDALSAPVELQVLVFTDPKTFDLVPLAVRWGRTVAVQYDGPEAEALRELLDKLPPNKGAYAIGRQATRMLLLKSENPVWIANRADALRRLGLNPDDLPPIVQEAIEITRDYLGLFV